MSRSKYDNKGYPWLRLDNWKKYQPDDRLRNKEAQLPWIRDYTKKLDNYDFIQLTLLQRALFEGLCLLAGKRPLRTIPNDPTYISRALHVQATDIPHVGHALATLISRGFVLPSITERISDEDVENAVREGEREGDREGEGSKQVSNLSSYEEADASFEKLDGNNEEPVVIDLDVPVHDLPCFTLLHEEFGRSEILPEPTIRRVHSALKALGKDEAWMVGCVRYTQSHKKFWAKCVFNAETFGDALIRGINDPSGKKLPGQYDHYVAQKRRAAGAGKR